MRLMTKELEKKLPKLYSQEKVEDPIVHVHYFNPVGLGDWYIIEYDGEDIMFGWCDLGEPELGYVSLQELRSVKLPLGLSIERDIYWEPKPLSEVK